MCELFRYLPRLFDQVGHQTTYASIGNEHFYTKSSDLTKLWTETTKIGRIFRKWNFNTANMVKGVNILLTQFNCFIAGTMEFTK